MFEDFDFSDSTTQYALGLAAFCEIVVVYSVFSSDFGWSGIPLWMKLSLVLATMPCIFFVAQYTLNK